MGWAGQASRPLSSLQHQLTFSHWRFDLAAFSCCQFNLFKKKKNHFWEAHDYYCACNHGGVEVILLEAFLQCVHSDQDVICISYPPTPCPEIETKHSVMSDCFELVLI